MATDSFGDAPVTGLGQEAAGRSVRGHGVLHPERKAQPRGQQGDGEAGELTSTTAVVAGGGAVEGFSGCWL
jgi:hypothetical protein